VEEKLLAPLRTAPQQNYDITNALAKKEGNSPAKRMPDRIESAGLG